MLPSCVTSQIILPYLFPTICSTPYVDIYEVREVFCLISEILCSPSNMLQFQQDFLNFLLGRDSSSIPLERVPDHMNVLYFLCTLKYLRDLARMKYTISLENLLGENLEGWMKLVIDICFQENPKSPNFNCVFSEACRQGCFEGATLLLQKKARILPFLKDSAIVMATQGGHLPFLQSLLDSKAQANFNQNEPLRIACQQGLRDIAKILIEHKADVHCQRDAPLKIARRNGYTSIVKLLEAAR